MTPTPRARILIVDDEDESRLLLERLLARDGHEVIEARDGEEALEVVGRESPDLILLDVVMPKLSGYDVLRRLKETREHAHIPVIIITGMTSDTTGLEGDVDFVKSIQFGADGYLSKPIDAAALYGAMASALRRFGID